MKETAQCVLQLCCKRINNIHHIDNQNEEWLDVLVDISNQIQLWNDTRQVLPCKSIISPQKSNVIELHFARTKLQLQSMENQCTPTVTALGKRIKCHRNCKGWDKWKNNYQFHSLTVQKKSSHFPAGGDQLSSELCIQQLAAIYCSVARLNRQCSCSIQEQSTGGVISNRDASTKIPGATQRDATCIYSIFA